MHKGGSGVMVPFHHHGMVSYLCAQVLREQELYMCVSEHVIIRPAKINEHL